MIAGGYVNDEGKPRDMNEVSVMLKPKARTSYPDIEVVPDPSKPFPKLTPAEYIVRIGTDEPKGIKFDKEKPKWSLVPRKVMQQVVEVLTIGARKYSPDNWMHVEQERYYDAFNRHVDAWRNGEKYDEETGKHHLAHAICCLMFMLWHDDNPKKVV